MIRRGCRFNEANYATADEAEVIDKPTEADEAEEADEADEADNTNEAIDAEEAEADKAIPSRPRPVWPTRPKPGWLRTRPRSPRLTRLMRPT